MRGRRFFLLGCIFGVMAAGFLLGLAKLPYARCLIFAADPADLNAPPTASGFRIGSIEWPVAQYAADPALQPFREQFQRHCAGRLGTDAALCVSRAMAEQYAFGEPAHDFLMPQYDPKADFAAHMAGEPGHCVTRSGILASELLSVGIPARVAQLLPPEGPGHTVVAVWDPKAAWQLVDPSQSAMVGVDGKTVSGIGAVGMRGSLDVVGPTMNPPGLTSFAYRRFELPGTDILYPEPWLYLRIGPRSAPRPFHGRFAQVGVGQWRTGRAQALLRPAIVGAGLMSLLCLGLAISSRRSIPVLVTDLPKASAPAADVEVPVAELSVESAGESRYAP